MKYDEFAFFNRQLAAMLRDGLPLAGALRRLCGRMRRGRLRRELEWLGDDLAEGVPLDEALADRKLPGLYVRMLEVGVKSNDLPGALTLMADYYARLSGVWTRLRGMLVYPVIVLLLAIAVSVVLFVGLDPIVDMMRYGFYGGAPPPAVVATFRLALSAPVVLAGFVLVLILVPLSSRAVRRFLSWRVPAFKHARIAQVAAAGAAMLKGGCTLIETVVALREMEAGTRAERELAEWEDRIAAGETRFREIAEGGLVFPPLFVWMADNAGGDLGEGFEQAAELYRGRAEHGVDMMLYGVLPSSVLVLGLVVLTQFRALFAILQAMMNSMGGGGW
jgi:type IV pilus assembly protein PilC